MRIRAAVCRTCLVWALSSLCLVACRPGALGSEVLAAADAEVAEVDGRDLPQANTDASANDESSQDAAAPDAEATDTQPAHLTDGGARPVGCGGLVPGCVERRGALECSLDHDGRTRNYRLHAAPSTRNPGPSGAAVVFMFHGLRTTAAMMEPVTGLVELAAREGFVLVLPEGVEMSFDAGRCCGAADREAVDDAGFTLAILDVLDRALCVDRRRVYATGLSNGGHMAYRLACEHADVFAAVSSVAGVVAEWPCRPTRPIPILHFHGTDDAIVRYDLGIDGRGAERTVADWAERNGCADTPITTFTRGEVTCVAYPACAAGAAAELCTIEGGGHQWPGGRGIPLLGHTTQDISASEASWALFARFARP